ncbi:MAG: filamentous hemagglutinin N-terminal domain-containing protein, partial [Prochloraceae cyanobacterium]
MILNKSSSAIAGYLRIVFISLSSIFVSSNYTVAQIIPDNTLGNERSQVQSNFQIRGINSDIINGGSRQGSNLFHSFSTFNIEGGRGAYFLTPTGINNILTRVTGGNVSNIFGTLGVLGNANLYLINPNGIYFGNGAKLDIRGSFTATTADGIRLGETGSFSAVNPGGDNLLTVQPGALFTNTIRNSPREIIVDRGELISTNDIAIDTDRLKVVNGGFIVIFQNDTFAIKAGAANLNIKAKSINIDGANGGILTGLLNLTDNGKNGGNLTIETNSLNVTNGARIENITSGAGMGGNLTLDTIALRITNGAQISTNTFGVGNAGNLTLKAQNITLDGFASGLFARVTPEAKGAGGNLMLDTNSLRITNGAQISASTFGVGNAGNLTLKAQNITLDGSNLIEGFSSGLFTQVNPEATGAGGNLSLDTNSLRLTNGAQISTNTFGVGNAGNLTLKAQN